MLMFNLFDLEIISVILKRFKIKDIVLSSLNDNDFIDEILDYYKEFGNSILFINSNNCLANIDSTENLLPDSIVNNSIDISEDYILNKLPHLNNYGAIFIQDDPNWFTIYNELNIIYINNDEFPLVFICNNRYPFKYRDSYIDPNMIPKDYLLEYSSFLPINYNDEIISVEDGFYHAIYDKTPKNGVLTAINDFLDEHDDIGLMDINLGEISILYPKSTISKIRIDKIFEDIESNNLSYGTVPDEIIENQLLLEYIKNSSVGNIENLKSEISLKNNIINDFENKVLLHNDEVNFRDSRINSINEELNSKNLEIENMYLKLNNNEIELSNIKNQLSLLNDELEKKENYYKNFELNLKNEFDKKERNLKQRIIEMDSQIDTQNDDIKLKEEELLEKDSLISDVNGKLKLKEEELLEKDLISDVNGKLKLKEDELFERDSILQVLQSQSNSYSNKLNSKEYCISCYKEELNNNKYEINYLKNNSNLLKKIMGLFSYVYLILKSNPNEISLNIKLYKALKNSNCFDIGYYLSNNPDIIKSKWCKYFSPELHYVCNGFSENRKFNKKYFNRDSKKNLLKYILLCKD